MTKAIAIGRIVLVGTLLLGGCAYASADPGAADNVYNNHTTAAGGWGLGPEGYESNGGAFGPDTLSR